jgi:hypothetical protein
MGKKSDESEYKIIDLNETNIDEYGAFCLQSKKNTKGYKEKFEWIKNASKKGTYLSPYWQEGITRLSIQNLKD